MIGCLGLISMDSWYLAVLDRPPINLCFRPSRCVRLTLHFTSRSERSWRLTCFITSLSFLASSSIRSTKCRFGPAAPADHNVTQNDGHPSHSKGTHWVFKLPKAHTRVSQHGINLGISVDFNRPESVLERGKLANPVLRGPLLVIFAFL